MALTLGISVPIVSGEQLAIVSQDTVLFDDSILENIRLGMAIGDRRGSRRSC